MTLSKTHLFNFGMIFISFFLVFSIFSCASTDVSNEKNSSNNSSSSFPVLQYKESLEFPVFMNMMMSGSNTAEELKNYIDYWEVSNPEDPELFMAKFLLNLNNAVFLEDNSDVYILPDHDYILLPDEETGELCYFYKDKTIILETFIKATMNLEKGIEIYPNRIDFWDNLLKVYTMNSLYEDAKETALIFLDTVKKAENENAKWYGPNNVEMEVIDHFDQELKLLSVVTPYSKYWTQVNPNETSIECAKEVSLKFIEVYPDNPFSYEQTGLAFMADDPASAIPYFEKAYEINPDHLPFSFDLAVCSLLTSDLENFEKYSNIIYNSGDQEFINFFDNNINMIISNMISSGN